MRNAIVVQHVPFENLGSFQPILKERGYEIQTVHAPLDSLDIAALVACDLLVVLGGPISVNDRLDFPFLDREVEALHQRLDLDRPTLGICLGAQLMAAALGARVYPGIQREIGWHALALTEAGKASALSCFDPAVTSMFHWHGDVFDVPTDGTLLASTPHCPNQAFAWGKRGLALQFHPEVTGAALEQWYVAHACELSAAKVRVPELRAEAERHGSTLERMARRFLYQWLESVE